MSFRVKEISPLVCFELYIFNSETTKTFINRCKNTLELLQQVLNICIT